MKKGLNFKTMVFGDSGEDYVSELFEMDKNPKGQARPDLTSRTLNPPIQLELKAGANRKGSLYSPQLIRAIHTLQDYEDLFHESLKKNQEVEEFKLETKKSRKVFKNGVSPTRDIYYYGLIDRIDGLSSKDLEERYSSIKIEFGDMFLAPYEFVFNYYIASKAYSENKDPKKLLEELKIMARNNLVYGISAESQIGSRRKDSSNWQDLRGNDILSFIYDDFFQSEKKLNGRAKYLEQIYPEIRNLVGVQIPGPNKSNINILCKRNHLPPFNDEYGLRGIVRKNTPRIEEITIRRKKAIQEGLLERINPGDTLRLFSRENQTTLSLQEIIDLENLIRWKL